MTKYVRLATALLLALVGCLGPAPRPSPAGRGPLILISIDGFRADYLGRGRSPVLAALAADGVRAEALKPAFPTLTFPNHYTLVTGLYPDHHGIVNNRFVDPRTGKIFLYKDEKSHADPAWWGGEPIWVTAQKQGRHTETVFWPGSDVAIAGVRPEHWLPFDGRWTPHERVAQALAWLDLPAAQRPDFLTLYFDRVDHAGHDHGPDSPEVDAAIAAVDAALGELRDGLAARGLENSANLVIVSDHGMAATSPERIIVLDALVDPAALEVINAGVLAGLAPKPGFADAVARALLRPHAHMRCWRKQDLPPRLHYGTNPRIPPIVCLADSGWQIETRAWLDRPEHHVARGEHGYDNDDPTMRALFVAHGPAFRRGVVVPEFDNVDIYPLLTTLLGIAPQPNDGDLAPLRGALATPAGAPRR